MNWLLVKNSSSLVQNKAEYSSGYTQEDGSQLLYNTLISRG